MSDDVIESLIFVQYQTQFIRKEKSTMELNQEQPEFKKPIGIPKKRSRLVSLPPGTPSPHVPPPGPPNTHSFSNLMSKITENFFFNPLVVKIKEAEEDLFDFKSLLSGGLF
jgi:hypothetical protein